jgi:hypothetical protein
MKEYEGGRIMTNVRDIACRSGIPAIAAIIAAEKPALPAYRRLANRACFD